MVFSSTIFLFAFLPVTLAGYYLLDRRFKNTFLLIASLFFYAWGEPRFVFVMLLSILMNYLFGLLVALKSGAAYRRSILVLTVAFNLTVFFIFKYLNFTIRNINSLAGGALLPQTDIALPIGISFFTFQAMSYVFDVYRGKGSVQKNPLNVALYVSLFPQLIAGPIVRYETVAHELRHRQETMDDFVEGIRRFILGLAKKVILSNSLAILADKAFGYTDFSQLTVAMAWLGALAYSLQIYFDFSGYSDMAIGLGLMFGFHFEENFNYPYISSSVSEFWRRWHISLGSWFRDYVYFPLGGSRVEGKGRLVRNLFVVWLLTGVWHGAAWSFVAWGLMYFVLITFEKLTGFPEKLPNRGLKEGYRVLTLLAVVLGWVIFRANGLKNGLRYIGCMLGLMGNSLIDRPSEFLLQQNLLLLAIAIICSLPLLPKLLEWGRKLPSGLGRLKDTSMSILYLAVFLLAVSLTVTSTYNPFIYFNF